MKSKIVPLASVVTGAAVVFVLADSWAIKAPALILWTLGLIGWVLALADRKAQK